MKKAFIKKTVGAVIAAATIITTITPLGVSAQWKQSNDGTWCYTDGAQLATGWKSISNTWYNFNQNGKMNVGWVNNNGTWYYFNNSGSMVTGWIKYNGKYYYADSTGAIQTGVIKINGKIYSFDKSGAMQVGNVKIGNKKYTFANDGQATGTMPQYSKELDSKGNVVKSTGTTNTNNGGSTTGTPTNTNNGGSTTGATTPINTNNGGGTTGATTPINTNNGGGTTGTTTPTNTNNGGSTTGTTTPTNTNNGGSTTGTTTSTNNNAGTTADVKGLPALPQTYSITIQNSAENKILELMNQKRTEAGLKPLTMDNTLLQVARYKSDHMIQYNYFDHTTPEGTNWTNWLKTLGYTYTTSGENIAYNTYDAVELFNQWWNSPGHRANMMNASFTKVGIGVLNGNGKYMGTQEFSN